MIEFGNDDPPTALTRLLERFDPVDAAEEQVADLAGLAGRVLAAPLRQDRDSPACDVSAMDGYAVRLDELRAGPLGVAGECPIGEAPRDLPDGAALRIYTGSPLPVGADTVVRLEWVQQADDRIRLDLAVTPKFGDDIRRQGENAPTGAVVLEAGAPLTPPAIGALAAIGAASVQLHRPVRVAVLTTGNELVDQRLPLQAGGSLPPWRLRNSNGPVLQSLLGRLPGVESVTWSHAADELDALTARLCEAAREADVVALTGGVSQGAYDFVPDAIAAAGGEIVFHGVRARPGRPLLGAVTGGVPTLGLPGNPLSVLTTARRMLTPVVRRRAGLAAPDPPAPVVTLDAWRGKRLPLTWWRPVRLLPDGHAALTKLRGSGDTCGPASSDGFVEVPPDTEDLGPYPFYPWDA